MSLVAVRRACRARFGRRPSPLESHIRTGTTAPTVLLAQALETGAFLTKHLGHAFWVGLVVRPTASADSFLVCNANNEFEIIIRVGPSGGYDTYNCGVLVWLQLQTLSRECLARECLEPTCQTWISYPLRALIGLDWIEHDDFYYTEPAHAFEPATHMSTQPFLCAIDACNIPVESRRKISFSGVAPDDDRLCSPGSR
jgi:hypothetical protein